MRKSLAVESRYCVCSLATAERMLICNVDNIIWRLKSRLVIKHDGFKGYCSVTKPFHCTVLYSILICFLSSSTGTMLSRVKLILIVFHKNLVKCNSLILKV